jgi:choline kinase
MKAIILAAGKGNRLSSVTKGLPKCMISINGQSLIHHQILSCRYFGIEQFVFVLGYKKDMIQEHILEILPPEMATFITNPYYETTNTLYSLWLTNELFDEDFIYFNADVMFEKELLGEIVSPSEYSQLLLDEKSCQDEEVKMILDDQNRILQIGKKLDIDKCAGEFIGIGKFNGEVLPQFRDALQYGVENNEKNNYFEYAVDILCREVVLTAVPTGNYRCIEIDFPDDLKKAKQIFGH